MKRLAASILFLLIFVGGFRPMFLRILVSRSFLHQPGPESGLDRRPLREKEDPTSPELRVFLDQVRVATKPGDSVAVVFAPPNDGWGYNYWRAHYVLAGRRVRMPGDTDANVVAYWPAGTIERRR